MTKNRESAQSFVRFSEQKSQRLWCGNGLHAAPFFLKKGEKERKCKNGNAACPGSGTGGFSLPKDLVEFAPAGAKKVQPFSPATCAAGKIPLGLQTCAPAASGGRRVRCSQAANLFVKK